LECFERSYKPRDQWGIGIELEKIGVCKRDLSPVQYDTAQIILQELGRRLHWEQIIDGGVLVGLRNGVGSASITLEPGAQIEIATAPSANLIDLRSQLLSQVEMLNSISKQHEVGWLSVGYQPFARLTEVGRVPKPRYEIMRNHFSSMKDRSLEMMYMTAATQINIDYSDRDDLTTKIGLAATFSPLVASLLSSCPIIRGKISRSSRRSLVWVQTDPARTGLPSFLFGANALVEYVRWALKAPMLMIRETSGVRPVTDLTFEAFMRQGYCGRFPTEEDWWHHVNLLFPDVRLRRTIEIRGTDSLPSSLAISLATLWKGLLYDQESIKQALRLKEDTRPEWVMFVRQIAARHPGLFAAERDRLRRIASDLISISEAGLQRLGVFVDDNDVSEDQLLMPLKSLVKTGQTPAEIMRQFWLEKWAKDPRSLVKYSMEQEVTA
jgi:glutamate--cysteine ligase